MATEYSEVYRFVRAVVGDDDPENYLYTDAILESHLDFYMAYKDDPLIQPGDDDSFDRDLTGKEKVLTALRIAEGLVAPQADYFAYKNPVLTVTRSGGRNGLLRHIRRTIDRMQGGFLHMTEDNEIWAYFNQFIRYDNDLNDLPLE